MSETTVEKEPFGNGCFKFIDEDGEDVIEVPLQRPIKAHGEERSVLLFHDPTLKQMQRSDSVTGGVATVTAYISISAGIPMSSAGELKMRDVKRCQQALVYFLGDLVSGTEA